ncbi:hypothetical protein [Sphingobium aromaticiconvertens]|uniref:hypothetical protein n=1 Tax=Sphingobium aromaticiconvertens TaxID=365341 RepID=UPI00301729E8
MELLRETSLRSGKSHRLALKRTKGSQGQPAAAAYAAQSPRTRTRSAALEHPTKMVEPIGIEPMT